MWHLLGLCCQIPLFELAIKKIIQINVGQLSRHFLIPNAVVLLNESREVPLSHFFDGLLLISYNQNRSLSPLIFFTPPCELKIQGASTVH